LKEEIKEGARSL